jgi:hypothetical protein
MKRILDIAGATLASLLPKSNKLEVDSYGHPNASLSPEEIQKIMEWLFSSLMNAEYMGKAYLIWDAGNQTWDKPALTGVLRDEPVFLYRCGDRPSPSPEKCYWRLITEHPSLRIYQLEIQASEND